MSMSSSFISSQSCSRIHYQTSQYKSRALPFNPIFDVSFSRKKEHPNSIACNVSLGGFGKRWHKSSKIERKFVVCSIEAGNPIPSSSEPPSNNWKSWVLGIIVSVILLPLAAGKLGPLSLIKDKFDVALQKVENVVERVEEVAGGIEKAAEHLLDELPEGQLKKVVGIVEHIAEKAAKDADTFDDAIDLVQEESEKLEEHLDAAEKKAKESLVETEEQK